MSFLRLQDQHPELQVAIADPTVTLVYDAGYRWYGIALIGPRQLPFRSGFPKRLRVSPDNHHIAFCPFSGAPLPEPVSDFWGETLERKYGLYRSEALEDVRKIPLYMTREDWWIDRGLTSGFSASYLKQLHTYQNAEPLLSYSERLQESLQPEFWPGGRQPPGFRRAPQEPVHYCYSLCDIVGSGYTMFWYLPHTREYGPRIVDPTKRIDNQPIKVLPVPFCPGCGMKLPTNLRSEWEYRVKKAGGNPRNPDADQIPPSLLTDEWWRSEGL